MSLSNIFNEPRREITETAIGLLIFSPLAVSDYFIARALSTLDTTTPFFMWLLIAAPACIAGAVLFVIMLSLFIHFVGEEICDILQDRFNIHLRPRRRS